MSDLRDLYQQMILDHNKSPQNFHQLEKANRRKEGYNPLCGDRLILYAYIEDDVIKDISFVGSGCAISKASASIMSTVLKGKSTQEAESLFGSFHELITSDVESTPDLSLLGKLAVFAGVREFPARVKCASLAWHTVHAILNGQEEDVTTE